MKIAYATPYNRRSAIGRGNRPVVEELIRRGHEVTLIMTEDEVPPVEDQLAAPCRLVHWRHLAPGELTSYRAMIVHFGDNFPFHAGALELVKAAPSIGVFHDLCMYNFFSGWLAAQHASAELHDEEVLSVYGEAVRPWLAEARSWRLELGEITERMPMVEWLAVRCAGALAHARHYAGRVEAACPGPVATAALPWLPREIPAPQARTPGERLTVATVGVMNANKCADEVIRAIAGAPELADRLTYSLIGPISHTERKRLEALAAEMGYARLVIHGAVDDETLVARLAEADIVCCLRRPILEGASGSLIEALQSARPVLVADAGVYGEVPDDLAFKIPANIPPEAIAAQLRRLADDAELRLSTGRRAASWARETFTAEAYVEVLEPLIEAAVAAGPMLRVGAQFGAELYRLGLQRDDPAVKRIVGLLSDVLPPAPAVPA